MPAAIGNRPGKHERHFNAAGCRLRRWRFCRRSGRCASLGRHTSSDQQGNQQQQRPRYTANFAKHVDVS